MRTHGYCSQESKKQEATKLTTKQINASYCSTPGIGYGGWRLFLSLPCHLGRAATKKTNKLKYSKVEQNRKNHQEKHRENRLATHPSQTEDFFYFIIIRLFPSASTILSFRFWPDRVFSCELRKSKVLVKLKQSPYTQNALNSRTVHAEIRENPETNCCCCVV